MKNNTFDVFSSLSFNCSDKCQAIASPSRSSSLANQTVSAFFASDSLISLQPLFYPVETEYILVIKSPSTFIPNSLDGKSAICGQN